VQYPGGRKKMKQLKVLRFGGLLFVLMQLAQSAAAVPAGNTSLYADMLDVPFNIGGGVVEVDSMVYQYTSGDYNNKYLYTYQIANIDSDIGLILFTVGILDGVNAYALDFDPVLNGINPALWEASDSPYQGVSAHFTTLITVGENSALLSYISDHASGLGDSAIFGTYSGGPYYAEADLLVPAPEPSTVFLLGFGLGGLALLRKRH
jgi:hypothetical protein